MKHLARRGALPLFFLLALLPTTATAQTYGDGSNESTTTRQQWIRGYRQQSGELQQKINALPGIAASVVPMPVLFGVAVKDLSANFGDPRDGGTRTHEGEDIMAVKGTPIVSPTPAVVLRTGVGSGEGNYVYTANPGGETFVYMHLDRIGEGVVSGLVLAQGSLIGYVGNTGNASGGAAHLHFEIHNNTNVPVDPFPRLTGEFSLQEKISYLSAILLQNTDSAALARLLVTNFRGTFLSALAANITVPLPVIDALAAVAPEPAPAGTGNTLPAGDLDIGSSGTGVVALQTYLIQAASGPASASLSRAGATGYFGTITQAALLEYQVLFSIAPSSGYYGAATRAFIEARPLGSAAPSASGGGTAITRNLYYGISGSDVLILQKILNAKGFLVAASGAGSAGSETTYFGPATRTAVIAFQHAQGITPAAGYVGPLTRAALASL